VQAIESNIDKVMASLFRKKGWAGVYREPYLS